MPGLLDMLTALEEKRAGIEREIEAWQSLATIAKLTEELAERFRAGGTPLPAPLVRMLDAIADNGPCASETGTPLSESTTATKAPEKSTEPSGASGCEKASVLSSEPAPWTTLTCRTRETRKAIRGHELCVVCHRAALAKLKATPPDGGSYAGLSLAEAVHACLKKHDGAMAAYKIEGKLTAAGYAPPLSHGSLYDAVLCTLDGPEFVKTTGGYGLRAWFPELDDPVGEEATACGDEPAKTATGPIRQTEPECLTPEPRKTAPAPDRKASRFDRLDVPDAVRRFLQDKGVPARCDEVLEALRLDGYRPDMKRDRLRSLVLSAMLGTGFVSSPDGVGLREWAPTERASEPDEDVVEDDGPTEAEVADVEIVGLKNGAVICPRVPRQKLEPFEPVRARRHDPDEDSPNLSGARRLAEAQGRADRPRTHAEVMAEASRKYAETNRHAPPARRDGGQRIEAPAPPEAPMRAGITVQD